jgi:hypothetical protein
MPVEPFIVRPNSAGAEVWSGYRIQFGGMERHPWQKVLKAELKEALSGLAMPVGAPFAGYYDSTDPQISDTENSLFTNVLESMPSGVTMLRFERGAVDPPAPPVPIAPIDGHLHYYRYQVAGQWTQWEPDEIIARWHRLPRRLSNDGSARPAWFALRDANAHGLFSRPEIALDPHRNFGLRLTVHATKLGPRNAISYSEALVDGTIAAFHNDRYSEELLRALAPKFPGVNDEELRRALNHPLGPLFDTPAIYTSKNGFVQISPSDERCVVGELTIRPDSKTRCPELSGELFTVRPIDATSVID